MSLRHGTAQMARAVVEGVCFSLKDAFLVLDPVASKVKTLKVAGGGTACREWLLVLSSVFNRALSVLRFADSSYGAGLIGLSALGVNVNPSSPAVWSCLGHSTVVPEKAWVSIYERGFKQYRETAQQLAGCYEPGRKAFAPKKVEDFSEDRRR
jgi:sugar (pentulose or hexulose) kinase